MWYEELISIILFLISILIIIFVDFLDITRRS